MNPVKTICAECGKEIYIFHSKTKDVDYACNSNKYNDFHKCKNWRLKPSSIVRLVPEVKERKDEIIGTVLRSADELVLKNKVKVKEISISRAVSYRYAKAKEYGTEKEEIFDNMSFGVVLETEITDDEELDNVVDRYSSYVDRIIKNKFSTKITLKLLTEDD